ncbi:MAG: hypothetical protein ACK5M4_09675 [Pseudorhodobacter sp.]
MAHKPTGRGPGAAAEPHPEENTLPDEEHPDFLIGTLGETPDNDEQDPAAFTPGPGTPPSGPLPLPPLPRPGPQIPFPFRFCSAVSGRYHYRTPLWLSPNPLPVGPLTPNTPIPVPVPGPSIPFNRQTITVRVDVDRFYPQNRISIEVKRIFPSRSAHVIAEVTSDTCSGYNRRTIVANITYRDGSASLIPGTTVTFRARRTTGIGYGTYTLELSGGGIKPRSYPLNFVSTKFDPVEFEVDRVSNAGSIVTSYNTHDHPNRPGNLPAETLTLATVYERAGFDVSMSPNTTVIPTSGAGSNGTWSDSEMHNAMVAYWSRFANRPKWAMWVLYAARHDQGRSLGGIMFDDIGPNHRQGTAIFTDSFIQDAPASDPDQPGWRRRMEFWTAIHEMGHAFNLAHSWQKALGPPQAPGDPWIPLANEPEARSYMNYPFRVAGQESAFFSDFRFRFTDSELVFMRHAPRRFVQMGNSNWFVNHGFEAPDALMRTGNWALQLRPNRTSNTYRFLEPVTMELKLTNTGNTARMVEEDKLADGGHVTVFIQREGGPTRQWRPMITRCHEDHQSSLEPGESIYGSHVISASTNGWVIDDSGFYKVQAAIDMGDEIIVSNVMRLYVAPPASAEEASVAPDYFTEDVGRAIAFEGAPELGKAMDVLQAVAKTCPDNPAARHASVATSAPGLRDFKVLDASGEREDMKVKSVRAKTETCARTQTDALLSEPDKAADTMGHIPYFDQLRKVAEAMEEAGDEKGAVKVMQQTIDVMKKRKILSRVIDNAEARLKRRT